MDGWITWALGILSNVIVGALAFFIKRNIAQGDERQKANEAAMQQKMERMESNLSYKIDRMQTAMESRIDKSEQRIEKLENRYLELIKEMPGCYVNREEWMLQSQTLSGKLDAIMGHLIKQGRSQ